jgi:hypothetical protein
MAKTAETTTTIEFKTKKATKGTVVFEEMRNDDERPHTFYMLNRLHDELGSPSQIVMTIEVD